MIRHVFMDLDNTLLDFSKAEAIAVKKTLNTLGIECPEAVIRRYSQLNLAQWKLLELGTLTREQVKIRRYQLLFNELGQMLPHRKQPVSMRNCLLWDIIL